MLLLKNLHFQILFHRVSIHSDQNFVINNVDFQITSCNAGKLAHCASVRLFPRVGPFVPLQMV